MSDGGDDGGNKVVTRARYKEAVAAERRKLLIQVIVFTIISACISIGFFFAFVTEDGDNIA